MHFGACQSLICNGMDSLREMNQKITQGEALERSNVEFNMLEDYINNPERQVSEAEKLGACVPAVIDARQIQVPPCAPTCVHFPALDPSQ